MTISETALPATGAGSTRRVPGQPDMWFFVLFETLLFTAYLGVYLFNRTQHPVLFLHAQAQLHLWIGAVNTIILLTSSWVIARCVEEARAGRFRSALVKAYLTAACGVAFMGFKVSEWVVEIHAGNTFTSNDFFSYYYFLTAIHFIHLLIGFVFLGVLVYQLRSPQRRSQIMVETCATYWHTLDYLWILIFALLYVVR
ncbi:MAG TPA: cytochrome c oxidase subunit 3 family protein [Mycobacteriales bacterium]|nr:cytochrome c oxidase subunit 3 family protein [Mycobacteriales bacterium]